jgi:hypothetical protein
MRKYFRKVEVRPFHLAVLAAVPLRNTPLFKPVWTVLEGFDRLALRAPGLRANRAGWPAFC